MVKEILESIDVARMAVEALRDKKGDDVKVIDISQVSTIADYFIIAGGTNPLQLQALADNVDEKLATQGIYADHTEGYNGTSWILMDYGDVVIHILSREDRSFYDLERIWRDGMEVSDLG